MTFMCKTVQHIYLISIEWVITKRFVRGNNFNLACIRVALVSLGIMLKNL